MVAEIVGLSNVTCIVKNSFIIGLFHDLSIGQTDMILVGNIKCGRPKMPHLMSGSCQWQCRPWGRPVISQQES